MVIPVADRHFEYADQVAGELKRHGLRVEVDKGKARMGGKIREARERHIPYMLVVGDKDIAAGTVSVRLRTDEDLGAMPMADFLSLTSRVVESHSLDLK